MKKEQPIAKWIALAAGLVGGALRYLPIAAGADEKGLYHSGHPGWIGYLALSVVMLVLCWWLSRRETEKPLHRSIRPVVMLLAFVGLFLYARAQLYAGTTVAIGRIELPVSLLLGILGLVAAAGLVCGANACRQGKNPPLVTYILPCLYFALEMFRINLSEGGEPEMIRFLPQFLATVTAALGSYQLWGRTVGLPSAKKMGFWRLLAGYLCIAAAPGNHVMYALVGLWLLFDEEMPPQKEEKAEDIPQ